VDHAEIGSRGAAVGGGVSADVVRLLRVAESVPSSEELDGWLYDAYRRRSAPRPQPVDREADRELLEALRRANCGRGTWEPDWRVEHFEAEGAVAVSKGGLVFFPERRRVKPAGGNDVQAGALAPGSGCRVFVPEERQRLYPGFYVALGDAERAPFDALPYVVRVYWHLCSGAAVAWVGGLSTGLNARGVPYRLKVASSHRGFDAADSGVLYLEAGSVELAWPVVEEVYAAVRPQMRAAHPLLTLRLAPGLAVAEGPADGASFGRDRVLRIASALRRMVGGAVELPPLEDRCRAVAAAFSRAGLDASRTHLSSVSVKSGQDRAWRELGRTVADQAAKTPGVDARPLEPADPSGPRAGPGAEIRVGPAPPAPPAAAAATLAVEAARIGDALCAEAWWHDERCNWMGRDPGERVEDGEVRARARALGSDLYQGSAGVGLFLAELATLTADAVHRRTAIGALERSLDIGEAMLRARSERQAGAFLPAFLAGPLGVAAAGLRVARLLANEALHDRSHAQLDSMISDLLRADSVPFDTVRSADTARSGGERPPRLDLLSGAAGVIVGLIALSRSAGGPPASGSRCLDAACHLGRALVSAAEVRGAWWSWSNRAVSGIAVDRPPLAGLSHGAAGIALALFELHAATDHRLYLDAARGAFAYEDTLFDPVERNWADLRVRPSGEGGTRRSFAVAWCHGAAGIALARLRAMALDPAHGARHREQAIVALERAREEVAARRDELSDASLCHGLCGLLDVLLCGAEALGSGGDDSGGLEAFARQAMLALLESRVSVSTGQLSTGSGWPSGVPSGGPNPSLFLGSAGVGHVLLRLAAGAPERPPSVLGGRIEG
jgi:hypothetical protein